VKQVARRRGALLLRPLYIVKRPTSGLAPQRVLRACFQHLRVIMFSAHAVFSPSKTITVKLTAKKDLVS